MKKIRVVFTVIIIFAFTYCTERQKINKTLNKGVWNLTLFGTPFNQPLTEKVTMEFTRTGFNDGEGVMIKGTGPSAVTVSFEYDLTDNNFFPHSNTHPMDDVLMAIFGAEITGESKTKIVFTQPFIGKVAQLTK